MHHTIKHIVDAVHEARNRVQVDYAGRTREMRGSRSALSQRERLGVEAFKTHQDVLRVSKDVENHDLVLLSSSRNANATIVKEAVRQAKESCHGLLGVSLAIFI